MRWLFFFFSFYLVGFLEVTLRCVSGPFPFFFEKFLGFYVLGVYHVFFSVSFLLSFFLHSSSPIPRGGLFAVGGLWAWDGGWVGGWFRLGWVS
ncbi:hypothetical protein DFH27DRAFT_89860 [Peziza echinospora]|nr:hypothetical protein DFH27DRAFT_89860 [Peziza echinospora]